MASKKLAPPRGGSDIWKDHNPVIKTGPVDHVAALDLIQWLTRTQYKMHRPDAMRVDADELIQVLNAAAVKPVLIGHHGIGGWLSSPRATRDVDIVVQMRLYGRAVQALRAAWPNLVIERTAVVTRFLDPGNNEPVIDVMQPAGVLRHAFRNSVQVGDTYCVPNLELALAVKFAAIVSPDRELERKYRDAGEFMEIIFRNKTQLNVERLRRLGDAVQPNGGRLVERFVEDVVAGRMLRL